MKPLITTLIASAALSWPGALSGRSQGAELPQVLAVSPDAEPNEDLAITVADVQQQVEVELSSNLEAVAALESGQLRELDLLRNDVEAASARANAQVSRPHGQWEKAQQAFQLAQAAPRASVGAAATPAPALQTRLQAIVTKDRGGPGQALVIRTSDGDAKGQANQEEDLAVMSRILDKTVAKQLDDEHGNRFMGINVLFAPGSGSIRNLYLEGYGALFLLNVNFPLLPPPEKAESTKEKSETNSTWEEAKQELYGQTDAWGQVGKGLKFSLVPGHLQEYDKGKVDDLRDGLLEALKNATNIRGLKADESITVCVFGGVSAPPGKARTWVKRAPGADAEREIYVAGQGDGPPGRGTIMTIRVKKADADAFAKGKLDLDDFRKKASITTYAGDTGGWSGGSVFGAP